MAIAADPDNRHSLAMTSPRTTFFTVAVGSYRMFAVPYAFSVLLNNDDAAVEVLVDGLEEFRAEHAAAIELVGDRALFREAQFGEKDAPYMRFLIQPRTVAPYVYIGDVDILILEGGITDTHIANAKALGLPYSNILRPGGDRLSGLHFTEWDAYYPVDPLPVSMMRNFVGDETLLRLFVERRGLAMPTGTFRPLHGIHMSPNRTTIIRTPGTLSWGVGPAEWAAYQAFAGRTGWRDLLPHLHPDYQRLIARMEDEAGAAFP